MRNIERIDWIIFDAMGVIYTEGDDVLAWVKPFILEKNPDANLSDLKDVYHQAARGEITSTEFFEHFGVEDAAMAMYEYTKRFPKLDEDFRGVAENLSRKYHIAMLSNDLDEWSRLLRRRFSLDSVIEKAVISGAVKKAKPDKDIFIYAIQELDTMPDNCLFIDDKEVNLIAARNLGFKVLRFNRTHDHFISNIDSINGFLELEEYMVDFEDRLNSI